MKINIYDWASAVGAERLAPYTHNQDIEGDRATIHKIVDYFLDKNLSVMVRPYADGSVLLAVDTKSFQQR